MNVMRAAVLCWGLVLGCQRGGAPGGSADAAGPGTSVAPSSAGAASPSGASGSAAPTGAFLGKVRGTWGVVLSPKQEKDLRTMGMVFDAQDPTPEQLASLAPDERATILAVRDARKKAPTDPKFLQMRAVLDGMARTTLVVYTSSLSIQVGQVFQSAAFVVKTETSTSVTLDASTPTGKHEEVQLALPGPDELRMSKPNQPDALTFRRATK